MVKSRGILLFLLLSVCAAGEDSWFQSDALGRAVSPVDLPDMDAEGYLLHRIESGKQRTDDLFLQGKLLRGLTVKTVSGSERIDETVEAGERRVIRYLNGLPWSEDIYRGAVLERSFIYGWDENRLIFTEMSAAGVLQYRQEYIRDPRGRLRSVIRFGRNEEVKILQFGYSSEGGLTETWTGSFESGTQTFFDGLEVVRESRINGTAVVARVERETVNGITREQTYTAGDVLISRVERTADGRLVREILYKDDGSIRRDRELEYSDDTLVASVIREPGRLEQRRYFYSGDDLQREELRINRRLVRIVLFGNNSRVEEYYRQDLLVLRKWYENDELVKEELYEEP